MKGRAGGQRAGPRAAVRTSAFALNHLGTIEGSEQRRDVT